MAEYHRALHRRIAGILSRMDAKFLEQAGILLEREVRAERDAIRTYIREDKSAAPIKFEIVVEARIDVKGILDPELGVPVLDLRYAIAEKLLANADRGMAKEHRARDVIDLAFISLQADEADFQAGREIAEGPYGQVILRELDEVLKMLTLDTKFRSLCVAELLIEDPKALRKGLDKLRVLKRAARKLK